MNNELRWKQRFQNFEKALNVFQARVEDCEKNPKGTPHYEAFQMALVQAFEIIIELAWKTLKDYLENEGYDKVKNGKQAIRQAFQDEIIQEPEIWMEALETRNLTSHTYENTILKKVVHFIVEDFSSVVWKLYHQLKK